MRGVTLLAVCAGLAAIACGSPAAPGASVGGSPAASAAGDGLRIVASGQAFDRAELALPAGRPFSLVLDNRDTLPHNVSLRDAAGGAVFTGEVFTGPGERVYSVPAVAAGTYTFQCDVHPEMKGTATAR